MGALKSETLLGTASIRVSALVIAAEEGKEDWYSIFNLNDIAGMIQLYTKFHPDVSKAIPHIEKKVLTTEEQKIKFHNLNLKGKLVSMKELQDGLRGIDSDFEVI